MLNLNSKPVVGIDIDGTLGDYHRHFLLCAEMFLQRPMPSPEDINPGKPLHQHMGVPKAKYREIKMAYRQGRWKRSMPIFDGAREFTVRLRSAGVEVAICTTRPFNQLGEVDMDTRWWLKHHGIQHDMLIWGPHKYRDLAKLYGKQNIVAVVDDEFDQLRRCHELGLPFYLRDQPYNQTRSLQGELREQLVGNGQGWLRTMSLNEAKTFILKDLEYWRERKNHSA